jgi:hypothetical protein
MIKKTVTENGIAADLFHDGSGQPRKAIVMMGGSEGGKTWSASVIKGHINELVNLGYTLLSLAYFKYPGLPQTLEEIPLEYFEKAFDWLSRRPEVIPGGLALIGGSKGAEVSLILGSMHPEVKAVVAMSPTHVVWQGFPKMGATKITMPMSSWTYQGKALPYVPYEVGTWNLMTVLLGKLLKRHEKSLQNTTKVAEALIAVEKIQGPVLLISGKRDNMWPSSPMSEQIISRLDEKGFPFHHQHIAYDTGHNGYIMKKDCWQAIYGFLKEYYNSNAG